MAKTFIYASSLGDQLTGTAGLNMSRLKCQSVITSSQLEAKTANGVKDGDKPESGPTLED